jgi:hypothetical protein
MYYLGSFWGCCFVYHSDDESIMIGPFECESDAELMCELLNSGKLSFNKGESYGKEDTKEPYSVY